MPLYLVQLFFNMLQNIKDIFKNASSFLKSGEAPPSCPPQYQEELAGINFLRSKKFFITFTSVATLLIFFGISVIILFLTGHNPVLTTPFVTMFVEVLKILAVIIASYLGLQTVLDFKWNSASNTALQGSQDFLKEEIDQKIIEKYADIYKNDKSYAPLTWVEEQPHE